MALASSKSVDFIAFINKEQLIIINSSNKLLKHQKTNNCTLICGNEISPTGTICEENNDCIAYVNKTKNITCAAISNCGSYIAACDSTNLLHLWQRNDFSYQILSVRCLNRKALKIIFTNSGREVLIADRGGDVFSFSVIDYMKPREFLLGHISLILDIAITDNDKYLITCDRDSKIRVSMYPNSYNIVSYCLGHKEFVSALQVIDFCGESLISGSGDGTLSMWNFVEGRKLFCIDLLMEGKQCEGLTDNIENETIGDTPFQLNEARMSFSVQYIRYCSLFQLIAVSFHTKPRITVYRLNEEIPQKLIFVEFIELKTIPVDFLFDNKGNVIVLTSDKLDNVQIFQYHSQDKEHRFISVQSSELTDNILFAQIKETYEKIGIPELNEDNYKFLFKNNFEDYDIDKTKSSEPQSKKNKS